LDLGPWTSSRSKKAALCHLAIIVTKVLLDGGQSLFDGPTAVALPIASLFLVFRTARQLTHRHGITSGHWLFTVTSDLHQSAFHRLLDSDHFHFKRNPPLVGGALIVGT